MQRLEARYSKIQVAVVIILRAILVGFIYLGIWDTIDYYKMDNTSIVDNFYGDYFNPRKEDKIAVISLNINSLRTEGWKAKNNLVRDFILESDANIVTI